MMEVGSVLGGREEGKGVKNWTGDEKPFMWWTFHALNDGWPRVAAHLQKIATVCNHESTSTIRKLAPSLTSKALGNRKAMSSKSDCHTCLGRTYRHLHWRPHSSPCPNPWCWDVVGKTVVKYFERLT